MNSKEERLNLETYIAFFHSPNDVTRQSLNKIISLHGFTKIYNTKKDILLDAVATLDLLFPFRSTVFERNTNFSADAWLEKEEVESDLAKLEWNECTVQSIETVKPKSVVLVDDDVRVIEEPRWLNPTRKKRTKRSVRSIAALTKTPNVTSLSGTAAAVDLPFEW